MDQVPSIKILRIVGYSIPHIGHPLLIEAEIEGVDALLPCRLAPNQTLELSCRDDHEPVLECAHPASPEPRQVRQEDIEIRPSPPEALRAELVPAVASRPLPTRVVPALLHLDADMPAPPRSKQVHPHVADREINSAAPHVLEQGLGRHRLAGLQGPDVPDGHPKSTPASTVIPHRLRALRLMHQHGNRIQ